MRLHRDERGQTIILVALSLPLLLGFVGIATDVGALFKDKRTMQTAADAGAIAGALNLSNGTYVAAAKAATSANGYTDTSNGVTVTVPSAANGPNWPGSNYYHQPNYIEVTITKTESTIFLALFGYPSVTVQARAVATNQGVGNGCVYTLGTSGPGLTVQGSLDIEMPDCAFNVNSTSTNAIVETGGGTGACSSGGGCVETSSVSAVGDIPTTGWNDFKPKPVGGVVASSDPLAGMQYPYTCTAAGCTCSSASPGICDTNPVSPMPTSCGAIPYVKHGNTQLTAGHCYNLGGGTTIGSQDTLTMSSGVFFFTNGALNIQASGTVNGTDITMVMTGNSTITMNGNPTLDLTADPNGTFPNILYYQVLSDTSALSLQGGSGTTINGVFYAPGAAFTMQGTPGGTIYADFVVKSLTLAGNPSFHSLADLPGGASVGLHAIALVE